MSRDELSVEAKRAFTLAGDALQAALGLDTERALDLVVCLNTSCGGDGIHRALMLWCDAFTDHATGGDECRYSGRVGFIQPSTGAVSLTGDGLEPDVVWAGKVIAARASMDQEAYMQLMYELPDDGVQIGQYVVTVLLSVAATMNGLPRGFALMGRG